MAHAHPLGVSRIDRQSLHDRVYHEVREAISSGRIAPSTPITIRGLADALGTSPMPVRDAIRRLAAEGVLESLPNRTVTVPRLTAARFREIRDIRIALEGMATEAAADAISACDLALLEDLHRRMRNLRSHDRTEYLPLNRRFHFTIYQASGMVTVVSIVDPLWLRIGPLLHSVTKHGLNKAQDHHDDALEALRAGDGPAARCAIESDISEAADQVLKTLT
jgi:DNA-binding GntR family transcriptional regulator